jgi:hypothetical protein
MEAVNANQDSEGFADIDIKPFVNAVMNEVSASMVLGDFETLPEEAKGAAFLIESAFDRHNDS